MNRNVEALVAIIGEVWPDGVFTRRLAEHLASRSCVAVDSLTDEMRIKILDPVEIERQGSWLGTSRSAVTVRGADLRAVLRRHATGQTE